MVEGSGTTLLGRDWLSKIRMDWANIRSVRKGVLALEKLREVFDSNPRFMIKHSAHLLLKSDAQPRFYRPCSVLFAIKDHIGKELDRLKKAGVLCRVEHTEHDLRAAYQQMRLDEESAKMVTINTHQWLYECSKLPCGKT